jgi:hypothetical protein
MKKHLLLILFSILILSCNSISNHSNRSRIDYKTSTTKKYKSIILKAKESAEIKIDKHYTEDIKLLGVVHITIKDGNSKPGANIAGDNTYIPGVGSIIVINYIDENLFGKLEHEFAHAIRQSNNLPSGHVKIHDSDFYNWKLTRELTGK